MMEASREAGIYDLKGIFGGDKGTCHKDTTVGINSSCCDVQLKVIARAAIIMAPA